MKCVKLFIIIILVLSVRFITAQSPIHSYELNGSYSDEYGGPSMVPNGGSLNSTSYLFDAGQGPSFTNPPNNGYQYAIEMRFTPTNTMNWNKLLDFNSRLADNGVYIADGSLLFFLGDIVQSTSIVFSPGVPATLCISRDGNTHQVKGYVDGVECLSVFDYDGFSAITGPSTFF